MFQGLYQNLSLQCILTYSLGKIRLRNALFSVHLPTFDSKIAFPRNLDAQFQCFPPKDLFSHVCLAPSLQMQQRQSRKMYTNQRNHARSVWNVQHIQYIRSGPAGQIGPVHRTSQNSWNIWNVLMMGGRGGVCGQIPAGWPGFQWIINGLPMEFNGISMDFNGLGWVEAPPSGSLE